LTEESIVTHSGKAGGMAAPLSETAAAIRYLEEGHTRGKMVIAVAATD
jgi:hypothetical protein